MTRSRTLRILLSFGFSLAGLAWIAFRTDWSAFASAISVFHAADIALGLSGLAFGYACRIVRWQVILRQLAIAMPLARTGAVYMSSVALNNLLPLRAGDVARVVWLVGGERNGLWRAAVSVAAERLVDAAALCAIVLVVLPRAGADTGFAAAVVFLLAVILLSAPWWFSAALRGGLFALRPLSARVAATVERIGGDLQNALASLRNPLVGVAVLALTAMVWLGEALVYGAAVRGLGLSVPPAMVLLLAAVASLSTLIPSAPGYVGTMHAAVIWFAELQGVDQGAAVALAVTAHLMLWIPTSLVGLACLAFLGPRPEPGKSSYATDA